MSFTGKLSRGLKWYTHNRDLDGVLKPHIANDSDKMKDVNFYLEYVKDKDKAKIELALYQLFLLTHADGGRKSQLYMDLKDKLVSGSGFEVVKVKGKK